MDLSPGFIYFASQLEKLLFSLGSHFSFTSLGAALLLATFFMQASACAAAGAFARKPCCASCFPGASCSVRRITPISVSCSST
jgi:hypothetical protein